MTTSKLKYMAVALVLAAVGTACVDEYEYTPAGTEGTDGIYLTADNTEAYYIDDATGQLSFKVSRHNTGAAATYHLTVSGADVAVPATIDFAPGEGEKTLTLPYVLPLGCIEAGLRVAVPATDRYAYGNPTLDFKLSHCHSVGNGEFVSAFFGGTTFKTMVCEFGQKQTGDEVTATYLCPNVYQMGHDLRFTIAGDCSVSVPQQVVYYDAEHVQTYYVSGSGQYDKKSNTAVLALSVNVPETGSSGVVVEQFTFPDGYDPLPKK